MLVEAVGYLGSALVVVSVLQRSVLKLRLLGAVASVVFIAYSVAIEAWPIAVVNVVVGGIHLWYLRLLVASPDTVFEILEVTPGSRYLDHFVEFFRDDLTAHAAEGALDLDDPDRFSVFVLRDTVPAGLFVGRRHRDGSVEVLLDYATPAYRDLKLGRFLYSPRSGLFGAVGSATAWTVPRGAADAGYFTRVGFRPSPTFTHPDRLALEVAGPTTSPRPAS